MGEKFFKITEFFSGKGFGLDDDNVVQHRVAVEKLVAALDVFFYQRAIICRIVDCSRFPVEHPRHYRRPRVIAIFPQLYERYFQLNISFNVSSCLGVIVLMFDIE